MRLVRAAAWIVLLVIGSIAAAGLVLALDHPPTDAGRPELTAADAAVVASRVAALEPDLERAEAAAARLATAGREVVLRLRAADLAGVADALLAGDVAAGELAMAGDAVGAAAAGLVDGLDAGRRLAAADRDRVAAIERVPATVAEAGAAWATVGPGIQATTRFLAALQDHEAAVERAAAAGRAGDHAAAVAAVGEADVALGRARKAAGPDGVAAGGDGGQGSDGDDADGGPVAAWTRALAEHDTALLALYTRLLASGGVRTDEVAAALEAEATLRAALPDPRAALASVLPALGGGGVTVALLRIEDARATIAAAVGDRPAASPGSGAG